MSECPKPPCWRPISASPRELWLPANRDIEDEYKTVNGEDGVLVGSQFEVGVGFEIRLPNRAPNKEFGDLLLSQLRRKNQLKPDIIDFNKRAMYEIKPISTFSNKTKEIIARHRLLYEIASDVRDEYNQAKRDSGGGGRWSLEPEWTMENAKWQPPSVIPLSGDPTNTVICTAHTKEAYLTAPGIIVYELWRRVKCSEEEEQAGAIRIIILDSDTRYDSVMPTPAGFKAKIGAYDPKEPDHIVIVPRRLHEAFVKGRIRHARDIIDKVAERSIPPAFDRKHPIGGFRALSREGAFATNEPEKLLLIGLVGMVVIAFGMALFAGAPEAAVVAGGTAAGGGAGIGAEVISLAARRLAAEAAPTLGKAAGIVLVLGIVSEAKGEQLVFKDVDAMRVIPVTRVAPFRGTKAALSSGLCIADPPGTVPTNTEPLKVGDTVMLDSQPHVVVALLRATPNQAPPWVE